MKQLFKEYGVIENIKRGTKEIDGIKIETIKADFMNANMLGVEVGTTTPCGGDSGHGGRTYLKIEDLGSTDLRGINNKETDVIEIIVGGDTEADTLISALKFAVRELEAQQDFNKKF